MPDYLNPNPQVSPFMIPQSVFGVPPGITLRVHSHQYFRQCLSCADAVALQVLIACPMRLYVKEAKAVGAIQYSCKVSNLHLQEQEMLHVSDADIFDKAISLLQWTTQELSSATVSKPKDGTFSLPSAFGSFHSDSLDAALRELESMQRSTSTERLHRCFTTPSAPGFKILAVVLCTRSTVRGHCAHRPAEFAAIWTLSTLGTWS